MHLSRTRVGFAGTKDKRAVTTQGFTVRLNGAEPGEVRLPDVEVLRSYRGVRALGLGDLDGNVFDIAITGLGDAAGAAHDAHTALEEARAGGGVPNFFGTQRFGALRPVTHRVGAALVDGEYARAVAE
jgi:tRNA pseudouridine13 synthase